MIELVVSRMINIQIYEQLPCQLCLILQKRDNLNEYYSVNCVSTTAERRSRGLPLANSHCHLFTRH